jgi:hypothetical protein
MRGIARARRWRPAFPKSSARGKLFFYSGVIRKGFAAFFHQHHGDHRPHVHLIEAQQPVLAVGHSHGGVHQETRSRAHSHDFYDHNHVKASEPAGHWHFTFAETTDIASTPYRCFVQVLTLDWVIISSGSEDRTNGLKLVRQFWARPLP